MWEVWGVWGVRGVWGVWEVWEVWGVWEEILLICLIHSFTTNYQLSTTNCQPSTINYQLKTAIFDESQLHLRKKTVVICGYIKPNLIYFFLSLPFPYDLKTLNSKDLCVNNFNS